MRTSSQVNELLADLELAARFGKARREHAVELFPWRAIAERTTASCGSLVG
jgi:glycosyltransferase involved in cell wall biosynthesis